jgi:hypothetical protein
MSLVLNPNTLLLLPPPWQPEVSALDRLLDDYDGVTARVLHVPKRRLTPSRAF